MSDQNGFSLIELMVVIAIFAILATFALFFSLDFFHTYATNSEEVTLVSSLSKARSQSLANVNRLPHGVHITPGGYTIFEGAIFSSGQGSNQFISNNSAVKPTGTTDVVFGQLTGVPACTPTCTINLSGPGSPKTVTINSEGAILW